MSFLNQFSFDGVQKAISTFAGVKRRQEILGEPGGILMIEDFAHHPTAVKQTIEAIQNKYKSRKVFSVFEPRSATSRRKVFQKDYVDAFSKAHEVLLAEAFNTQALDAENRFSSAELISDLKKTDTKANVFASADDIVTYLKLHAKKTDVILIMSNGGFDGICIPRGRQTRQDEACDVFMPEAAPCDTVKIRPLCANAIVPVVVACPVLNTKALVVAPEATVSAALRLNL